MVRDWSRPNFGSINARIIEFEFENHMKWILVEMKRICEFTNLLNNIQKSPKSHSKILRCGTEITRGNMWFTFILTLLMNINIIPAKQNGQILIDEEGYEYRRTKLNAKLDKSYWTYKTKSCIIHYSGRINANCGQSQRQT